MKLHLVLQAPALLEGREKRGIIKGTKEKETTENQNGSICGGLTERTGFDSSSEACRLCYRYISPHATRLYLVGQQGLSVYPVQDLMMVTRKGRKARVRNRAEFEECAAARSFWTVSLTVSLFFFCVMILFRLVFPQGAANPQKSHQNVSEGKTKRRGSQGIMSK